MTVFVGVDHRRPLPAEQEVPKSGAESDGQTQIEVVGHEDQHQEVGKNELYDVQQRLDQVADGTHSGSAEKLNCIEIFVMFFKLCFK